MSTQPTRRPSISLPHPARAADEAARGAEASDQPEQTLAPLVERPRPPLSEPANSRRASLLRGEKPGTVYFPSADDRQRAKAAFLARGGVEGYTCETEWWAAEVVEHPTRAFDVASSLRGGA